MNAVREFGNSSVKCRNTWASGWPTLWDTAFEEAPAIPKGRPGLLATEGGDPARRHYFIIRYNGESVNPQKRTGPLREESDR